MELLREQGLKLLKQQFPEQAPERQLAHLHRHKLSPGAFFHFRLFAMLQESQCTEGKDQPDGRSRFIIAILGLSTAQFHFGIPCLQVFQAKVQFSAFAGHAGFFGVRYGS